MRINAGSAKGRLLKSPRAGSKVRPTGDKVKSAFFNIIGTKITTGSFLDLFAGTGSIGIEALSRGCKKCVFVDKDKNALRLVRENLCLVGFTEQACLLGCDALRALQILKKKDLTFNVIYLDPPYDYSRIGDVLETIYNYRLLNADGYVGVERRSSDQCAWLAGAPFTLNKQKKYGNTQLILLSS